MKRNPFLGLIQTETRKEYFCFMCDLSKSLKLCTCNGIGIKEADWILERSPFHEDSSLILGESVLPYTSSAKEVVTNIILVQLNNTDCFDFPYKPETDDLLKICINKTTNAWLKFIYQDQQWIDENHYPFGPFPDQFQIYKHGLVKNENEGYNTI